MTGIDITARLTYTLVPPPAPVGCLARARDSVLIVATVVVGAAVDARYRLADLQPWHKIAPPSELRAADIDERFTLADYLKREQQVFDEVRTRSRMCWLPPGSYAVNRYVRTSRSSPSRLDRDYNRTFEVEPDTLRAARC